MGNARFVYIAPYLKKTITDSQIIGWLELYQQKGIAFDLILMSGVKPYFREKSSRRIKIIEAREKIAGRIYDVFSVKPSSAIYQVIVFIILFFIIFKEIVAGATVIIQIRNASANTALRWLKSLYPKLKIIYDIRGATAEEYLNTHQRKGIPLCKKIERVYNVTLNQDLSFIDVCDKAFCVSNRLKEYYFDKKEFNHGKFEVIPCCADDKIFFPDNVARVRVRKELGIAEDRVVMLYSGGLDKAWQIPDFVFHVFEELNRRNAKIFFMCLTPHWKIVAEFIAKLKIEKSDIWSGYIEYQDVNNYLNAADVGLLFREDNLTNNVASPTKFAEYLLSGLPTLISKGIGDLSDFVAKTPEAGYVIDNDSNKLVDDIFAYLKTTKFDRSATARIGMKNYSKKLELDKIVSIFQALQSDI